MLRLYFKTDNTEDLNIIKDVNNLFNSTKLTKIESIKRNSRKD